MPESLDFWEEVAVWIKFFFENGAIISHQFSIGQYSEQRS